MCNEKKTPHVHAELIKAWADGAKIQFKRNIGGMWFDIDSPSWAPNLLYRIKPEPKPDVTSYACVVGLGAHRKPTVKMSSSSNWNNGLGSGPAYTDVANVKFVFDGETGKLKNVCLIKE